eukprot:TRINITY_DN2418_c0_g1_i1.p1 TRINITY_DN2418_c0_g1~~TRINITY_DN2418_c0_g1_i1.p1  ORF type:complete len:520 (-),score=91.96 TRINITY_DN2418_c0_g1_i1:109-1668(-)
MANPVAEKAKDFLKVNGALAFSLQLIVLSVVTASGLPAGNILVAVWVTTGLCAVIAVITQLVAQDRNQTSAHYSKSIVFIAFLSSTGWLVFVNEDVIKLTIKAGLPMIAQEASGLTSSAIRAGGIIIFGLVISALGQVIKAPKVDEPYKTETRIRRLAYNIKLSPAYIAPKDYCSWSALKVSSIGLAFSRFTTWMPSGAIALQETTISVWKALPQVNTSFPYNNQLQATSNLAVYSLILISSVVLAGVAMFHPLVRDLSMQLWLKTRLWWLYGFLRLLAATGWLIVMNQTFLTTMVAYYVWLADTPMLQMPNRYDYAINVARACVIGVILLVGFLFELYAPDKKLSIPTDAPGKELAVLSDVPHTKLAEPWNSIFVFMTANHDSYHMSSDDLRDFFKVLSICSVDRPPQTLVRFLKRTAVDNQWGNLDKLWTKLDGIIHRALYKQRIATLPEVARVLENDDDNTGQVIVEFGDEIAPLIRRLQQEEAERPFGGAVFKLGTMAVEVPVRAEDVDLKETSE